MANLRRRSSRLSKAGSSQPSAGKTPVSKARLDSLVERDETPDAAQQSIDGVLATPTTTRTVRDRLAELSALRTPQTEPRPGKAEMDPKTAHRSTTKAPDSGLKLGFSDIPAKDKRNDTPSKSVPRQTLPTSAGFEFKFSSDSHLSSEARELMSNVREDAARIKAQLMAEKAVQDQNTDKMFGAGRRIAQPKGRAGRFSDVHMAQFKKMDSIANHASAFRARPGFAAPTTQSLKRSPSKAGLDELERPRTAGKGTPGQARRIPPPVTGRPSSISPFKSIPASELRSTPGPAKRIRQSEQQDVSDGRPISAIPRPATSLYSPTKATLARAESFSASPKKPSMLPRSNSVRSTMSTGRALSTSVSVSPSKPLPALPTEQVEPLYPELPSSPSKDTMVSKTVENRFTSRLPTLSGLKSILRGGRKEPTAVQRPGTPKRPNSVTYASDSPKKVDFTPSVKSRHAVKLAVDSPSPAKIRRETPYKSSGPVFPYDSSAYTIQDHGDDWGYEDTEITYPTLPPADASDAGDATFVVKSKEHNRRESKEFKSIFTTLHPQGSQEPATLTSVNTRINKTNPETHADRMTRSSNSSPAKQSPATIRRVRSSAATELVQPFEDKIKTVPHGLPGKKRRHESVNHNDKYGTDDDAKENRRISAIPPPRGDADALADEADDERETRASKRTRLAKAEDKTTAAQKVPVKKSAAREAAAKNAKERKSRGVLSMSRLNMLSRPKTRG